MAIRKPTAPADKSAAMAEMLASADQETKFKNGALIEGTVTQVKDDDVYIDIGYKSVGMVSLDEFKTVEGETPAVKPGDKVTVLIKKLEDDKTGIVDLSKRAADDKIRWEKILERYVEGCVVTGTVKAAVRGGLIVQVDDVEAFLPGSQIEVTPVKDLEPYVGQTFDFKVIKISNERRNLIISRRELIEGTLAEKRAELLASLQKGEIRKGRVKNITDFGAFIDLDGIDGLLHELGPRQAPERNPQGRPGARRHGPRRGPRPRAHLARPQADHGEPLEHDSGAVPGRRPRFGQGRQPRRVRRLRRDCAWHRGSRPHLRVQLDEARRARV